MRDENEAIARVKPKFARKLIKFSTRPIYYHRKSFGFQERNRIPSGQIYFRRWHLPFFDCAFDWFYRSFKMVLVSIIQIYCALMLTAGIMGFPRHSTETVDELVLELHLELSVDDARFLVSIP
jgi:hypothetical protein